ncbi:MAG: hypothetical protein JW856_01170 [Dehalococcoidales bacterium]|nr:hypothetical protein [Dehalococcoidales bacterium]
MVQKAFADRLMDACDQHAEQIAEQWYKSLSIQKRTSSFRTHSKENCIRHAVFLYKNLKRMYFADNPYQEVSRILDASGYAEEQYGRGIPLSEAVYALVLIRRHVWLYAESSALFSSPDDMYPALQSTNRILLLFDYATYIVIQKYGKMAKH